jgi:hypothetical protein
MLAQGPFCSLKTLDLDLHNLDFEAPDPRSLQHHVKTHVYEFGQKNVVPEAHQRSLRNAGKHPGPTGPQTSIAQLMRKGSRKTLGK